MPSFPKVGCPKILEIQNPWEKCWKEVVSELNIFVGKWSKVAAKKKFFFPADFALQNMVETRLPDGLEISGQRVYR